MQYQYSSEYDGLSLRHYLVLSNWFDVIIILSHIFTHNNTHNETSDQNKVNQRLLYPTFAVQLQSAPVALLS